MSPLKKGLSERIPLGKVKYLDIILKIEETVKTVIRSLKFLSTHDFAIGIPYRESRGLMTNIPMRITVSTVSFSNSSPFLSGLSS